MLKSGDVIVMDEQKLRESAIGAVHSDVRQGKSAVRKLIEDGDDTLELVVVRVERVGRSKPKKPAFDCVFDDDTDTGSNAS